MASRASFSKEFTPRNQRCTSRSDCQTVRVQVQGERHVSYSAELLLSHAAPCWAPRRLRRRVIKAGPSIYVDLIDLFYLNIFICDPLEFRICLQDRPEILYHHPPAYPSPLLRNQMHLAVFLSLCRNLDFSLCRHPHCLVFETELFLLILLSVAVLISRVFLSFPA